MSVSYCVFLRSLILTEASVFINAPQITAEMSSDMCQEISLFSEGLFAVLLGADKWPLARLYRNVKCAELTWSLV